MLIQVQYLFLSIQLLLVAAGPLDGEHNKPAPRRPGQPGSSAATGRHSALEDGARKRSQEQKCNQTEHDTIPKRRIQSSGEQDNGPPSKSPLPAELARRDREKKSRKVEESIFREQVDHYPEEEIKLALRETPSELKELFNVLNTPMDPNANLTERIAYRYNDDYSDELREENICRTVTRFIYPREAKRDNTLVYIPNDNEFMQMIQVDICENPESECNYLSDMLPHGMSSACKQKYSMKKLLYLNPLEKKMASGAFPYPSCCSCVIKIPPIESRVSKLKPSVGASSDSSSAHNKQQESLLSSSPFNVTAANYSSAELSSADTESSGPKRRAKALSRCDNKQQHQQQNCPSEGARATTTGRPARQTKAANKTPTLVLNEDKVYKPDNETRK